MKPNDFPVNEVIRLERLRRLRIMDTAAEAVLDGFTETAAAMCGSPISLVSLVDERRQWFKSAVGLPQGGETPREVAFCAHAIEQDELFEVPDARLDPRFKDNPFVTGPANVVHYAGMPLLMPEGERAGSNGNRAGAAAKQQRMHVLFAHDALALPTVGLQHTVKRVPGRESAACPVAGHLRELDDIEAVEQRERLRGTGAGGQVHLVCSSSRKRAASALSGRSRGTRLP